MSANAARRPRRGQTATTEPETAPVGDSPAIGDEPAAGTRPRRRGAAGAGTRVVAFPEPTPPAYTTPPTLPSLATVPRYDTAPRYDAAPAMPREQPALLHPTDRRGLTPAPPAYSTARSSSVDQLAIGEIDQTLFDCPQCRRPLP